MWDLWWTKLHWGWFPLPIIAATAPHSPSSVIRGSYKWTQSHPTPRNAIIAIVATVKLIVYCYEQWINKLIICTRLFVHIAPPVVYTGVPGPTVATTI
jgi:hypothetical protein